MIPRRFIEEWRTTALWPDNAQVEQDLVIERTLVELFSDDLIGDSLAFRGGTALHKLYLKPQARYSEDIDLVQIRKERIGPILKRIRERLEFLGIKRTVKQKIHNNTIVYRFDSEFPPIVNLRLKIEINSREHFSVLGLKKVAHKVESGWFSGACIILTYELEELLGTKLRALYQRRKGRDMFDFYHANAQVGLIMEKVFQCYEEYMIFSGSRPPSIKQFLLNLKEKQVNRDFTGDMNALLRPGVEYDQERAFEWVKEIFRKYHNKEL